MQITKINGQMNTMNNRQKTNTQSANYSQQSFGEFSPNTRSFLKEFVPNLILKHSDFPNPTESREAHETLDYISTIAKHHLLIDINLNEGKSTIARDDGRFCNVILDEPNRIFKVMSAIVRKLTTYDRLQHNANPKTLEELNTSIAEGERSLEALKEDLLCRVERDGTKELPDTLNVNQLMSLADKLNAKKGREMQELIAAPAELEAFFDKP